MGQVESWTSGLRRTSKTGARAITSGQRLAGDRARDYKCRWWQYTRQSFDATSRHERKQFVDLRSVSVSIPWRSAVIMGADGNLAPHRTCQQWRHTGGIHRQRIPILTSAPPPKPRGCRNAFTRWGTVVVKRSPSSFADPTHALIGRVPVGDAPVGVAVLDDGSRIAVINSNRFGNSNAALSLTIIDAQKITSG